jgi:hypothetical protein
VPASPDLSLIPFLRIKGQEWPNLPGLRIIAPPKRAARGRENDQLMVYLSLAGNNPFPSKDYEGLITTLAERFFQSPGASGLRMGADSVNQSLMERNLRTTGKGQYLVGRLILGVLRGTQVFFALCGPVHVFQLSPGKVKHIHEEQSNKGGLGASQTLPIHFSQLELQANDTLVMCASLPTAWEQVFNGGHSSFDNLQSSLLSASNDDLNVVLVEVKAGKGRLTILRRLISKRQSASREPALSADQAGGATLPPIPIPTRPVSQVVSSQPASRFSRLITGQVDEPPPAEPEAPSAPTEPQVTVEQTSRPARLMTRSGSTKPKAQNTQARRFVSQRARNQEIPEISRPATENRQQVFRGLAKWMRGVQVFSRSASAKTRSFLATLLPNLREGEPNLTNKSMAFIAIVIPLLVVMVAMSFYNRNGKATSYQENYEQARAQSVWASAQTTPADIRVGWERTLYYLNIADDYQETEELIELRRRAQMALDNLDSILRLEFNPAIVGGLSPGVEVARLAATNTDLYLLDAARGSVLRFYLGGAGYLADTSFSCGPGVYEGIRVGELIDIMAAPKVNPFDATVIALDASGTILFCNPSPVKPTAMQLATPSLGWREIKGFTMDATSGDLYILDPLANAVWYYAPDEGGFYSTLPVLFFGAQVPDDMASVIDFATNGADLYLLFQDGHAVACTLLIFEGVPKRCSDPAYYIDNRPERAPGVTIADAYFSQMTFAEAPDQGIYFFDPLTQAVYKFSPRTDSLILQSQFRAGEDERSIMLASTATAMAISPNRHIFISVSGQVYMAADVP